PRRWFRPCLELLEDRCVLSSFTVTNLKDDGSPGCLRSRIIAANNHPGADTVVFKPGLQGNIKLTDGQITSSANLSVLGPSAALAAVDGNGKDRLFNVDNMDDTVFLSVTLQGLEFRNGKSNFGGGMLSRENLTLSHDVIDDNLASSPGGGR